MLAALLFLLGALNGLFALNVIGTAEVGAADVFSGFAAGWTLASALYEVAR